LLDADARALVSKPIRNWADLVLAASIAAFWRGDGAGPPFYPYYSDSDLKDTDDKIMAYILRGIFHLAGLRVIDGRGRTEVSEPEAVLAVAGATNG
jgi:hypothetical protein